MACGFSNPDVSIGFKFVAALGISVLLLFLLRIILSVLRGLYTCYLAQILGKTVNFRKLGEWAVVTGSTDGIGKAYAEQLAAKGLNIVLLSRTLSKLETVAAEIESRYGVKTKIIAVDFSSPSLDIYDAIKRDISQLDIGVLVNNVGLSYPYCEYFTLVPEGEKLIPQIIQANCTAASMMMRLVLPGMVERRRGAVINVSSISSMFPLPLLGVYAGTKAYLEFISVSCAAEYSKFGIIVQCVKPAYVSTKMSKIRRATWDIPTPDEYVKHALSTVGVESNTYGYPPHKLRGYMQEVMRDYLPSCLVSRISQSSMEAVRKAYYKKKGIEDVLKGAGEGSSKKSS